MGSLQELSLDFTISSKIVSDFIAQVSGNFNGSDRILKLEEYINGLQDEMKKVDAFKSALPLVRLLVNDVFARLKEELARCKRSKPVPVFEEFIPLKNSCTAEKDKNVEISKGNDIINNKEKRNWLSHVQLWNSDNNNQNHYPNTDLSNNTLIPKLGNNNKKRTEEEFKVPMMDDLFQSGENRAMGTAFMPFKRGVNFPVGKNDNDELPGVPKLSLCTPEITKQREINPIGFSPKSSSYRSDGLSNFKAVQPQTARKQRRCWSPELRRRFLDAIQQLGGGQAATPKQIRELMQVDGLTNDEVKSHLQKYRMHNMKQEQRGEYLKTSNSQSGSPQGPLHLTGSSQVTSVTRSDNMEDEEVEKSENHSWKMQIQLSGRDNV